MGKQIAPDTAEGWAVQHVLYHVDWEGLKARSRDDRQGLVAECAEFALSRHAPSPQGQSGFWHVLGHRGDLMALHYAENFEKIAGVEREIQRLGLSAFLKPAYSFSSMIELGMYYATMNIRNDLDEEDVKEGSDEWKVTYAEKINEEKEKLRERRFTPMPQKKYLSFYPMNKRRVPGQNWYTESLEKRSALMMEHGHTGRSYAGRVQQIISGSIGFDDWEWAVDLFSDDPLAIKRLVYEMRFDEGSAVYADFGPFYLGVRLEGEGLEKYLLGE